MALTDITVRNAKPREKQYKLTDEKGSHVRVMPNGSKYHEQRYRFNGKEKLISLGTYPETSLAEAREQRDQNRKLIKQGIDPSQARKEKKLKFGQNYNDTFNNVAREWHEIWQNGRTPRHVSYVLRRMEADILPTLGAKPINDVKPSDILAAIREIEARGALDIAKRALQTCSQIFRYAIVTERIQYDPTIGLRSVIRTPVKSNHSYLQASELPEFLSKLNNYDGHIQTRLALRLLILTFVRTKELRGARWQEVNFDTAEWRIPAERMKMRELHIVPLSRQALGILHELKKINGPLEYIFPSLQTYTKCMSENTMLYALYRMGYHSRATVHGFRATSSTTLNEHGFRSDVIERQLAHGERNKVRNAYNHAQYLKERREMMQWWADHLDKLAENGQVINLKFGEVA